MWLILLSKYYSEFLIDFNNKKTKKNGIWESSLGHLTWVLAKAYLELKNQ